MRTTIAVAGLFAVLGACGDDDGTTSTEDAGGRPDAFVDVDGFPRLDAGTDAALDAPPLPADGGSEIMLPTCDVLGAFDLGAIDPPEEGSEGYEVPSDEVLSDAEAMVRAVAAARYGDAMEYGARAGYEVCRGVDAHAGLILMQPLPPTRGWARIAVRTGSTRGLIFEAPHPVHDMGTVQESVQLFMSLGARAVIVSGTHRCANANAGCSGSSSVCGTPDGYRESDAAHATNSIFHAAHVALAESFATHAVVSVHGMAGDGISLSDGTTDPVEADSPVTRAAMGLEAAGFTGVTACNDGAGVTRETRLCGTDNVQGRHLNGAPDACAADADSSSKRFLHLEQSPEVRMRPGDVAAAFATAFPM
jgi:hypothetical protein